MEVIHIENIATVQHSDSLLVNLTACEENIQACGIELALRITEILSPIGGVDTAAACGAVELSAVDSVIVKMTAEMDDAPASVEKMERIPAQCKLVDETTDVERKL